MDGTTLPSSLNTSGLSPQEYNILVKPEDVEDTTKGGLILPDEVKERDGFSRMEGILVAASPMAFAFEDWPDGAEKPAIGDRVMFARHQGTRVTGRDGAEYWMMKDKSIMAVME